ncbi:MAG: hypothetical protein ACRC8S_13510 [Fimbriiglobus sp.]
MDTNAYHAELTEILSVCRERGTRPKSVPHCAICARYSQDTLPFETLLAFLDVLPTEYLPEALARAEQELSDVLVEHRSLNVSAITMGSLLSEPGFRLVRSLTIDMSDQQVADHFDDPRLSAIEAITLLGFAYDTCYATDDFASKLGNSSSLKNVRTLTLHSTSFQPEVSHSFLSTRMAQRLQTLDGGSYVGSPAQPLTNLRELSMGLYEETATAEWMALLAERSTPNLQSLSISAYGKPLELLFLWLSDHPELARRCKVSLNCSDYSGEYTGLVSQHALPEPVEKISWYSSTWKTSLVRTGNSRSPTKYLDQPLDVDLRLQDRVQLYPSTVFDWRLREHVSRSVQEVVFLLPLDVIISKLVEGLKAFPSLTNLSLIYPFSIDQLKELIASGDLQNLDSLSIVASISGGQWNFGRVVNAFMMANEKRYQSQVPIDDYLAWFFSESPSKLPNLSLTTLALEITRDRDRLTTCEIRSSAAAVAFARHAPPLPIEHWSFDFDSDIKARAIRAMCEAKVWERIYGLSWYGDVTEEAVDLLQDEPGLRSIRRMSLSLGRDCENATRRLLTLPNWLGLWQLSLPMKAEEMLELLDLPVLNHLTHIGGWGQDVAKRLAETGRLARLRSVDEGLHMSIFEDARLAQRWLEFPLGRPLVAGLQAFVARMYRIEYPPSELPRIIEALRQALHGPFEELWPALHRVFSTAFQGTPCPEGTLYVNLTPAGQAALQALREVDDGLWNYDNHIRSVVYSYGFHFWGKEVLENYILGVRPEAE